MVHTSDLFNPNKFNCVYFTEREGYRRKRINLIY